MDPAIIGLISFPVILLILLTGVHIGIVLLVVGFIGLLFTRGAGTAFELVTWVPVSKIASYSFAIVPLFMVMGELAMISGTVHNFFLTTRAWFGRIKGGLGLATLATSVGLAACIGSTLASAAVMTRVALPEMEKYGYKPEVGAGIIAASGTMAIMIPPSIILVLYAIITETSIGAMLLAGFIPGVWSAILYASLILFRAWRNPKLMPPGPSTTMREKINSLKYSPPIVLVIAVIIGGLYFGVFTPSEVGGIGAFIFLVMALPAIKRNWRSGRDAVWASCSTTGMIFLILIGAFVYSYFIAVSGTGEAVTSFITGLEISRWVKLIGILLIFVFLGFFLDTIAIMAITLPLVFPAVMAMGFNPIWFGILQCKTAELGAITPPMGLSVFVVKGVAGKKVDLWELFRNIFPFAIMDVLTLATLLLIPEIVLFLPSRMG